MLLKHYADFNSSGALKVLIIWGLRSHLQTALLSSFSAWLHEEPRIVFMFV